MAPWKKPARGSGGGGRGGRGGGAGGGGDGPNASPCTVNPRARNPISFVQCCEHWAAPASWSPGQ